MEAAEQRSYCPHCNAVFRTPFPRCPLDGAALAACDTDPLVGTTLDKRYEIEECIGEGGMGRVYRAKHVRMSRQYAIKILFGDHAGDTRMRSRFAREAEAVSRLNHVNVISVVDFGETHEGLMYLVMDLASGQSLAEVVHNQAPMPSARVMSIVGQLLKGLAHAHAHGLVHRDFKCENVIMVTEEGREVPKIVDFGICMIIEDHPSATMLTSSGMVLGTPAVMAPEQASGAQVDNRTDLFSLGIVAYQMLSGLLPFDGTPLDMARKNLYETIPTIYERSGIAVAPDIQALVSKLTEKDPDKRFQTAGNALAQLAVTQVGSWTDPTPIPVTPPRPTPHPFASASPANTTTPNAFAHTALVTPSPNPAMHTEHVSPYNQPFYGENTGKKRNKGIIAAVMLLVAGIVLAVALSGEDGEGTLVGEGESVAAIEPGDDADAAEENDLGDMEIDDELFAPINADNDLVAKNSDEKTVVAPEIQTDTTDAGGNTADSDAKKTAQNNRRKTKNKNRQKNKNTTTNTVPKPPQKTSAELLKAKIQSNLNLHKKVGHRLSQLRKRIGADGVRTISSDYYKISRTRLSHEARVQDEYSATLRRLLREIKSK